MADFFYHENLYWISARFWTNFYLSRIFTDFTFTKILAEFYFESLNRFSLRILTDFCSSRIPTNSTLSRFWAEFKFESMIKFLSERIFIHPVSWRILLYLEYWWYLNWNFNSPPEFKWIKIDLESWRIFFWQNLVPVFCQNVNDFFKFKILTNFLWLNIFCQNLGGFFLYLNWHDFFIKFFIFYISKKIYVQIIQMNHSKEIRSIFRGGVGYCSNPSSLKQFFQHKQDEIFPKIIK